MPDDTWLILATRAGLDVAIAQFPEDVEAAAATAAKAVANLVPPANPADEPWPAMRTVPQ